ncbi:MAG TPA: DUF1622 domain-containing protein [Methanolinea sp.]|jgi:uncharacterized membrane protein|nr:MAG: hypothetical protein A4E36_02146 [Methanoregulaceae archaeon PtaB.Bin009]OPY39553.1 MAG: hypothetical protein A4E41_01681 [Methanoregulaceae archaeon PtaU1.Bin066]HII76954.1 DUF1622 domain-containing protein [Methanolinea sp.]HNQ29957.1 DUF1622 domain-containing protein [Methanolinea sp.]
MDFALSTDIIEIFAFIFGIAGAALIIYGGLRAVIRVIYREVMKRDISYNHIRRDFTSKIVFGLEFFIAADILTTFIAPTQEELILLAVVVIIRTVLGYFLARETKEFPLEEE